MMNHSFDVEKVRGFIGIFRAVGRPKPTTGTSVTEKGGDVVLSFV